MGREEIHCRRLNFGKCAGCVRRFRAAYLASVLGSGRYSVPILMALHKDLNLVVFPGDDMTMRAERVG